MQRNVKNRAALAALATLSLGLTAAGPAAAQFGGGVVVCTNCSNVATQAVQHGLQVEQLAQQAADLAQQVQMYQNMLQNTAALPEHIFGDAMADIQKITGIINEAKGLAFTASNLEEAFNARYGTFESYSDAGITREGMRDKYEAWSADTNDSVLNTLRAVGAQADGFADEAEIMQRLQAQASSAEGQMQALSVGNALGVQAVAQTQKLRQLVMLQLQMQARALQGQQDREAAELARALTYFEQADYTYSGKTY
jgi:P-type conjugative transfer protein TrbJ